jgi:hypothetical protein
MACAPIPEPEEVRRMAAEYLQNYLCTGRFRSDLEVKSFTKEIADHYEKLMLDLIKEMHQWHVPMSYWETIVKK